MLGITLVSEFDSRPHRAFSAVNNPRQTMSTAMSLRRRTGRISSRSTPAPITRPAAAAASRPTQIGVPSVVSHHARYVVNSASSPCAKLMVPDPRNTMTSASAITAYTHPLVIPSKSRSSSSDTSVLPCLVTEVGAADRVVVTELRRRTGTRDPADLQEVDAARQRQCQFGVLLDEQQRRTGLRVDAAEHRE